MRPPQNQEIKRRKRTRDKLIRLDDLIPEKDVKGGRQLPFGVTDTTQNNEKNIENKNGTEKRNQEEISPDLKPKKTPRAALLPRRPRSNRIL